MTDGTLNRPLTEAEIASLSQTREGGRFASLEADVKRSPQTGRILVGPDGPDDKLFVTFSVEPRFSVVDTVRAGGVPQYRDVEMITIYAPGMVNNLTVHTEVTDYYQWRFPMEYAAFKAGREASVAGIPLIHWPEITPALLKELEYHGIRTVEQVASLPDYLSGSLRGLRGLKAKAQVFIEQARDIAGKTELENKLAEQESKFIAEMAAMKEQIAALLAAGNKSESEDESGDVEEASPRVQKDGKGRFTKKE